MHVYRFARELAGGKTVVDIGCGTGGKLARYVAPVAQRCVGVDQASGIAVSRRNHPHCEWIDGDLSTDTPWDQARGVGPDLVICLDVIEHVPDPCELLDRLARLGGNLLISAPDRALLPGASDEGPPTNPSTSASGLLRSSTNS